MTDASFEDGAARPLRLRAFDADDLQVMSALVQDAVFPGSEMTWSRKDRRFAILLNRYRWEDGQARDRVQSMLVIEDVLAVQTMGVIKDADTVMSLLSMAFEPGPDGAGRVVLTLAGDGAIGCDVEALEVVLKDVSQAYGAISGKAPAHPD